MKTPHWFVCYWDKVSKAWYYSKHLLINYHGYSNLNEAYSAKKEVEDYWIKQYQVTDLSYHIIEEGTVLANVPPP